MNENNPTSPTIPAIKSLNNNSLIGVLIVLVLILLGATGFLAYQNYLLRQQVTKSQVSTYSSPSPSSTTDETANWKEYVSSKFGFSFKYPAEGLKIREGVSPDKFVYIESTQMIQPGQQVPYYFYVGKFNVPSGISIDQILEDNFGKVTGGFQFGRHKEGPYTIYSTDRIPSQSG